MNIFLVASSKKAAAQPILEHAQRFFSDQGAHILGAMSVDELEALRTTNPSLLQQYKGQTDLFVSIGGDGALLMLAHILQLPLPTCVGINIGSLGFLTEVSADQMEAQLGAVLGVERQTLSRLMLEGSIFSQRTGKKNASSFAINECTMHRGSYPTLIDIAIHVDGAYLNTFSCDGVIVSTPSGSTAYSLAAGGPILAPDLQAVVITPICAHTISNRPVVFLPKRSIRLECVRGGEHCDVSFDGQDNFQIERHDTVEICVSEHRFTTMLPISGYDYFHTIRTKLGWSGSLRT